MLRLVFLVVLAVATSAQAASFTVSHPRCEFLTDPLGIEVARPRLSWELASPRRGARQVAYRIVVARSRQAAMAGRGEVWDSGRVESAQSAHVGYGGPALAARDQVFWRVKIWDDTGAAADGPVASWENGLLDPKEWKAGWIGLTAPQASDTVVFDPKPVRWIGVADAQPESGPHAAERFVRRRFTLPAGPIQGAVFMLSGADQFILWVNGALAGGARDWKFLEKIDVRDLLIPGENALALQLRRKGGGVGLAGQLRVQLDGAAPVVVNTDGDWKGSQTRQPGWMDASFDDARWAPVRDIAAFGEGQWAALKASQTRAQVISAPSYARKAFTIDKPIRRARLYATALGVYEASINGKRVGDLHLAPGFTDYNRRVLYQTYDVTGLVKRGPNAIGAIVAEGWYAGRVGWMTSSHDLWGKDPQRVRAQLEVEHTDGSRTVVASDGSWKASFGPIVSADLMDGESHDARKEMPGWDTAKFDDAGWKTAETFDESKRNVVADVGPPVRVMGELKPKTITEPRPGTFVFDMGQNMVGWVKLRTRGPSGTAVQLRFAEMLNPDGTIYTENLRAIKVTDRFVLAGKGQGDETWEPRFTFHGFRYVEVKGLAAKPTLTTITGRVAHSDMPAIGSLVTSNAMLNQLQHNIVWGQKGNFLSVPTDCPQRDERLGWMGDAQIFAGTACFNMDVTAFFTKWMDDVEDSQSKEGAFSDVVPRIGPLGDGSPAWGDAGVIVPWTMYQCYGDRRILEKHYGAMTRWIEYVRGGNPDLLWVKRVNNNYGDWLSIKADTDKGVIATQYFAQTTRLVGRIARVLGKDEDAARYEKLFGDIRAAFQRAYVGADGRIKGDTQTVYVLALRWDLLPEAARPAAIERLVTLIKERDWHLSTGFLGVGHLLPALTENGQTEVAYKLLMNDTFPSWGYSIRQGATTIWERWDGWTHDKGFQTPAMNSFNHYSLGSVGEWMYRTIGGIDSASPGYEELVVRPVPGGGLTHARAEYRSIKGRVVSSWKLDGKIFRLQLEVPMNTRAKVYLPYASGKADPGVTRLADGGYAIGAGKYQFTATHR